MRRRVPAVGACVVARGAAAAAAAATGAAAAAAAATGAAGRDTATGAGAAAAGAARCGSRAASLYATWSGVAFMASDAPPSEPKMLKLLLPPGGACSFVLTRSEL